jgi:1,2-diacylglycerol 3-alpha-glucosyltransferase
MRIAYVGQSYPPMVSGAAIVVQRLAHGMVERGHTVLVLAASDRGRPYAETQNGLQLVRLRSFPNPLRVGQRFALLPGRAILSELRSFQPDVMHSHDPLNLGTAGILAARSLGIPTVLTIHQLPWFVSSYAPNLPGLRRAVEAGLWVYARWVARQCDRLVAPSRTIAAIVAAHRAGSPEAITNGVDLKTFSPRPASPNEAAALRRKYDLDPVRPIMLHVGRIDADKQVERVVEAAARVLQQTSAQLLIVGDGKQRKAVIGLSEALGIHAHARFPGYISAPDELSGLYRLASVFVTASEIETQCLVALEALSAGVPVVTVDTPVMTELVKNGVNGFLVAPRDSEAIAERLVYLLCNLDRARAMGEAGRAIAERHSLDASFDAHAELYQSLSRRAGVE